MRGFMFNYKQVRGSMLNPQQVRGSMFNPQDVRCSILNPEPVRFSVFNPQLNCSPQNQPYRKIVPKNDRFGLIQLYEWLAHLQVSRLADQQVSTLLMHYSCSNNNTLMCEKYEENLVLHISVSSRCWPANLPTCSLTYFPFLTHPNADLPTCADTYKFPFIFFTFLHPPSAYLLTCQLA